VLQQANSLMLKGIDKMKSQVVLTT
jgi:hypothetical protein